MELNSFSGRGLAELPLGVIAYLFPQYLPIVGLDLDNPAVIFLAKLYGVAVMTISLLSIYTGNLEEIAPLRRQVALVLMGYSSMMVTIFLSTNKLFTFTLVKFVPPETFMIIVHGMFTYEFYKIANPQIGGGTGITID